MSSWTGAILKSVISICRAAAYKSPRMRRFTHSPRLAMVRVTPHPSLVLGGEGFRWEAMSAHSYKPFKGIA
jgi:hypothetical protein